jgi:hypothetical protein
MFGKKVTRKMLSEEEDKKCRRTAQIFDQETSLKIANWKTEKKMGRLN